MRVLVCGSRSWKNKAKIAAALGALHGLPGELEVIHGGAAGADRLAGLVADELEIEVTVYVPDWDAHRPPAGSKRKNPAGAIRNRRMLDSSPDIVLAFWDGQSPGTQDTIREAERRGIVVEVIT